jgi:hypothetical protein
MEVTFAPTRDAVAGFAQLMEQKLALKDSVHPNGWGTDDPLDLYVRADDRMNKLYDALEGGTEGEINEGIGYCVDVANWMMMIADNLGAFGETLGR